MAYVANTSINPLLQSMQRNAELAEQRRIANQQLRAQRIAIAAQLLGTVGGAITGGVTGGIQGVGIGASLGGSLGQTVGGLAGGKQGAPIALTGATNLTNAVAQAAPVIAQNRQQRAAVASRLLEYSQPRLVGDETVPAVPAVPAIAPELPAAQIAPQAGQQAAPQVAAQLAPAMPQQPPVLPPPLVQPTPQVESPAMVAQAPQAPQAEPANVPPVQQLLSAPVIDQMIGLPPPVNSEIPANLRTRRQQRQLEADVLARAKYHDMARELVLKSYFGRTPGGGRSLAEIAAKEQIQLKATVQEAEEKARIRLGTEKAIRELNSNDPMKQIQARKTVIDTVRAYNGDMETVNKRGDAALTLMQTGDDALTAVDSGQASAALDFVTLATLVSPIAGAMNAGDVANVSGYANDPGFIMLMGAIESGGGLESQIVKTLLGGDSEAIRAEFAKYGVKNLPPAGRILTDDALRATANELIKRGEVGYMAYDRDANALDRSYRTFAEPTAADPKARSIITVDPDAITNLRVYNQTRYQLLKQKRQPAQQQQEVIEPDLFDYFEGEAQ